MPKSPYHHLKIFEKSYNFGLINKISGSILRVEQSKLARQAEVTITLIRVLLVQRQIWGVRYINLFSQEL